jgi:hypothetical protein
VQPTVTSVEEATPERHRVLFIANRSDEEEIDAVRSVGADILLVDGRGTYPEKINAGYRSTDDELLFLAADDLTFHPGWLTAARAMLADGVHVVGTNDLGNQRTVDGTHSTHTLVTRAYCDQPGAAWATERSVLHEGYRHWFVDDELVGVAQHRGVYAHAHDSIVEHLHPFHGKAEKDATYKKGEERKSSDAHLFRRRRALWT